MRSSHLSKPLRKKRLDVWIVLLRLAQLRCVALEGNSAIAQHDELGLIGLIRRRPLEADTVGPILERHVFGDKECIPELMRNDDRTDRFEIAQLDDLFVDG